LQERRGTVNALNVKKILKNTSISNFNAICSIRSDVIESFHVGKGKDGRRLNLKRKTVVNGVDYTRLLHIILVNY
jgi:hypothetical protein